MVVSHCLLVETNGGLVLVDTGVGLEFFQRSPEFIGRFKSFVYGYQSSKSLWVSARDWISELGFKASDVTHIIPTHLDFDHCGDLVDFPGARVHVRTVEHERAHQPVTAMDKLRYLSRHFDHGPLWQLYDDPGGDAWYGFDTVRPLVGLDDDLLLVALPGHSVGHVGVAVRAESGWILHAGDAYYQRKHLFDPPTLGSRIIRRQIDEDAQIAEDTQRRLASVIGSHPELTVICSHDPSECSGHSFEVGRRLSQTNRRKD